MTFVNDLKDNLELTTKDLSYKDVRDKILSYVERKRDVFGKQLTAMEVDSHEKTEHWGGGDWDDMYGESTGDIEGEMYSFQKGVRRGFGKVKNSHDYGSKGKWKNQYEWNTK